MRYEDKASKQMAAGRSEFPLLAVALCHLVDSQNVMEMSPSCRGDAEDVEKAADRLESACNLVRMQGKGASGLVVPVSTWSQICHASDL